MSMTTTIEIGGDGKAEVSVNAYRGGGYGEHTVRLRAQDYGRVQFGVRLDFRPEDAAALGAGLRYGAKMCGWEDKSDPFARALELLRRVPLGDEVGKLDPLELDIHAFLAEFDDGACGAEPAVAVTEPVTTADDDDLTF
jgi:hypothetical protein